jgi:Icc-related predicted phosphoesterase
MRMVYTADLHGDRNAYRALLDLAVAHGAQAAVVGGDLLPHTFRLHDALSIQRAFVGNELRPLLEVFRAGHPDLAIYLLAGNDDWAAAIETLGALEEAGLAIPLHNRVVRLPAPTLEHTAYIQEGTSMALAGAPQRPEVWLAGYACVPLTPFSIKDFERRDAGPLPAVSFEMAYVSGEGTVRPTSAEEITQLPGMVEDLSSLAQRSDPARTIYVCHSPPAQTPLDLARGGRHVGSRALRAFIERHQPPLTLHGHIHEAPELSGKYATRIGATWCVNPGNSPYRFHAVVVDLDEQGIRMEHTVFGKPDK